MSAIGTHCILEMYDCPGQLIDDEPFIRSALHDAVRAGFATLIGDISHRFTPHGVTALALIAESHVAIHTWPEHGYVAADVFTCGDSANAERACEALVRSFSPQRHDLVKLDRGTAAGVELADAITRSPAPRP